MINEEAKAYVNAVNDYLIKAYGEIKPSWKPLIDMLGTEYTVYCTARDSIERDGLVLQISRGVQANPAIAVQNNTCIQIQKLVEQLGISPKMEAKMSKVASDDEANFFDALTK